MSRRDDELFAEFVHARSAALRGVAYLLAGRRGLADDLLQEALVATYVAWPRLRDPSNAEAYARRVMTTKVVSWSRRRSWREQPTDLVPEGIQAGEAEGHPDRDLLWRAVYELPVRQRAALVLRYYEDLSITETADLLACTPGTVKSQVHAAMGTLRSRLGARHPELVHELSARGIRNGDGA